MRPNKTDKDSVPTIFTKCTGIFYSSPFLISHPNRFRSTDLGDSFPPGEAMGAAAPIRYTTVNVLTKADSLIIN